MSALEQAAVRPHRSGALAAPAVPTAPQGPRPSRPRLHVVRPPAHQWTRVPFVVLCMGVLVAAMLGTLLLNTSMAKGEYDRFELESTLARSAQSQQEITEELERRSSAPELAAMADALGMVPAAGAGYVRLADGVVLGDPRPAGAPE